MDYKRWYDKYPELNSLLSLLEGIDKSLIEVISQDFLQIIMNKYQDKFDIAIKDLATRAPKKYNRWYDVDYNLHTCIEFLKTLDEHEKKDLINSFINSIMSFVTNVDNA